MARLFAPKSPLDAFRLGVRLCSGLLHAAFSASSLSLPVWLPYAVGFVSAIGLNPSQVVVVELFKVFPSESVHRWLVVVALHVGRVPELGAHCVGLGYYASKAVRE
jgi:hypothetical protein